MQQAWWTPLSDRRGVAISFFLLVSILCGCEEKTTADMNSPEAAPRVQEPAIHTVGEAKIASETAASLQLQLEGDRSLTEADKAKCLAAKGFVYRFGMLQVEGCNFRFADVGQSCVDGSECLSNRCLYEGPGMPVPVSGTVTPPSGLRGACAADSDAFGCHTPLKDGVPVPTPCID